MSSVEKVLKKLSALFNEELVQPQVVGKTKILYDEI